MNRSIGVAQWRFGSTRTGSVWIFSVTVDDLPKRGQRLRLDGALVYVEVATLGQTGVDLLLRRSDGSTYDKSITLGALAAAVVPEIGC